MSNSTVTSRTAPKIILSDKPEEDIHFYLQFVIPLVPKLIEETEKSLAAEWINKLTEDKRNPELRADYLLLLLFALQRRQLSGPFLTSPSDEALQPFEDNLDMFQMMERMVKQRTKPAETPPYYSAVSGDFKEYVVTQEIPDFGVHCYLATSNEPIQKWKNAHLAQIPREITAEAYQIGSRSCFETPPVQLGSSEFTPPSFQEGILPDREGRRQEYSVNLQALQSLIPRDSYMPEEIRPRSPRPEGERAPSDMGHRDVAPNDVPEFPIEASNIPPISSEELIRQFQRSQDILTSAEIDKLMAEFEEKLRSEAPKDANLPAQPIPIQGTASQIPRPTQAPRPAQAPGPSTPREAPKPLATSTARPTRLSKSTNPVTKSRS